MLLLGNYDNYKISMARIFNRVIQEELIGTKFADFSVGLVTVLSSYNKM